MSLHADSAIPRFLDFLDVDDQVPDFLDLEVPDFLNLAGPASPLPLSEKCPPVPDNPPYVAGPPVAAGPITPMQIDIKQYSHPCLNDYAPAIRSFFRVLAVTGMVSRAIDVSGVTRYAVYKLKEKDPVFKEIFEDCLRYRGESIEDEAYRRAVNGVTKAVYYMGRIVGFETVYSDTLMSKMLEGAMPEKYRSNFKIDMDANVKGAIATLVIPAEMSESEWQAKYNEVKDEPKHVTGETFYDTEKPEE